MSIITLVEDGPGSTVLIVERRTPSPAHIMNSVSHEKCDE